MVTGTTEGHYIWIFSDSIYASINWYLLYLFAGKISQSIMWGCGGQVTKVSMIPFLQENTGYRKEVWQKNYWNVDCGFPWYDYRWSLNIYIYTFTTWEWRETKTKQKKKILVIFTAVMAK